MREARSIMGMPVQLEIVDESATSDAYEAVFDYLRAVDERFSTYKDTSEISRINRGELTEQEYSKEMKEVFALAEKTREETDGYFNIRRPDGSIDPSGLVKGWAIQKAAELLRAKGYKNFYLEVAGDIQTEGKNAEGKEWSIGIRNPFARDEIVKVVYPRGNGVATSGTYIRGAHLYNPKSQITEFPFSSFTVIGPTIYDADRFATAAFVRGEEGLLWIEQLDGYEGYAIDTKGIAHMTSGFEQYTKV